MAARQPQRRPRPNHAAGDHPGQERAADGRRPGAVAATVRGQGRFGLAAAVAGAALAAGRRVLAAARGETGRRLLRAAALTMALAVLVVTLYDRGEVPRAAAQPAVGGAPGGQAARPPAAPTGHGELRGRTRPAQAARSSRPAEVAAAWYAARLGLSRDRVQPLQQDKLSAREVRVLVLADAGPGRLRTALVRVRRTSSGWGVP
jgi:hypothetical protein